MKYKNLARLQVKAFSESSGGLLGMLLGSLMCNNRFRNNDGCNQLIEDIKICRIEKGRHDHVPQH